MITVLNVFIKELCTINFNTAFSHNLQVHVQDSTDASVNDYDAEVSVRVSKYLEFLVMTTTTLQDSSSDDALPAVNFSRVN